jgi:hypothetical protein
LDLLTPYTQHSELHATQRYCLPTLYSSPLHTHQDSQSSLVVSWQRIYNSLTITSNHTLSSLHSLINFFRVLPQLPTPKSRLNSIPLLPSSYPGRLASRNSTQFYTAPASFATLSFMTTLHGSRRKHVHSIVEKACLHLRCLEIDVLLLRVGSGGNVFTKSLPSSGSIHHNYFVRIYNQSL